MIHIAICDDEPGFVAELQELVHQYAREKKIEIKISVYFDGEKLLEKYDTTIDLIFLDIKLKELDGLHVAENIRQMDEQVDIIFISTYAKYGIEGYQYHAVNFLLKPIKYVRLKSELSQWLEKYQKNDSPFLVITNKTGTSKVLVRNLKYIETFQRKLLLHTDEEEIVCYKKMKELEEELTQYGFVRCHSGFLVNLFYVKRIEKMDIILTSGERLTISQPKRKEFMERLADYWGDML